MMDKTLTNSINMPPVYSYGGHFEKRGTTIRACTIIFVTIIIAATICFGIVFVQYGFRNKQDTSYIVMLQSQTEQVPVHISLIPENKLEYVNIPRIGGFDDLFLLRSYEKGLMAMKELTGRGSCLISLFSGKENHFDHMYNTLKNSQDAGLTLSHEASAEILMEPIQPELLNSLGGDEFTKLCNTTSYWITTKNMTRQKRNSAPEPESTVTVKVPAVLFIANPEPLSEGTLKPEPSPEPTTTTPVPEPENVPGPGNYIIPIILGPMIPVTNPLPEPVTNPSPEPMPTVAPEPVQIMPEYSIPRQSTNTCQDQCGVAIGSAAINLAQGYYLCSLKCIPNSG